MNYSIEEKTSVIKDIHKNSFYPAAIINEDKEILYYNEAFEKKFKVIQENLNKIFNSFSRERKTNKVFFNKSISYYLLNEHHIFTITKNHKDHYYKTTFSLLDKINNKRIYFLMIIELTDIKEILLENSINSLIKASTLKDNDTGQHVKRINEYCDFFTRYLYEKYSRIFPEINEDFIKEISKVAALHDVGKIGTPDYILAKPSKLTAKEFKIIQEHTINGALILSGVSSDMAKDIALFHHEKWDGTGYPYKLYQDNIPLSARIVAVVDVYDALRMKRHYKNDFSHNRARNIIIKESGKHFQPELVDTFQEIESVFNKIFSTFSD